MASKKDIQEMLRSMEFQPNYIKRALKVYEKHYGHSYNVEVITEIIIRLQDKDKEKLKAKKEKQRRNKADTSANGNTEEKQDPLTHATQLNDNTERKKDKNKKPQSIPPFRSHMTLKEALSLKVHDKIDHRDCVGRFVFATVKEKQETKVKIHYAGWSKKWDTWSDFEKEIRRFAAAGSISLRKPNLMKSLKKGDYVDVNPTGRHSGWTLGEIRRIDAKAPGQVQVCYEHKNKSYLYWTHLDNEEEITTFATKSATLVSNVIGEQKQE
eukprot:1006290_1